MHPSVIFYIILVILLWMDQSWITTIIFAMAISYLLRYFIIQPYLRYKYPVDGAALITGTSSGFGRNFACRLASKGILVFAGVRKEEDGVKLKAAVDKKYIHFIIPIILDVANVEDVKNAQAFVEEILRKKIRNFIT